MAARLQDISDRLFNCCANGVPPQWSRLSHLVVSASVMDDDGHVDRAASDESAEFWTVYAYAPGGESEAITDCDTRADAERAAREISALSGLPIYTPVLTHGA